MDKREMTISRGLTRLKTIKAQLSDISTKIGLGGAINNKTKHFLGGQKATLGRNHNQAKEEFNSLYQKFNDLLKEYTRIKLAIDKANIITVISVGGKEMTIQEALIYKRDLQRYVQSLHSQFSKSVDQAQTSVEKYNKTLNTEGMSAETIQEVMADIIYLVPKDRLNEVNNFLIEFITELDGTLNEINALTEIDLN